MAKRGRPPKITPNTGDKVIDIETMEPVIVVENQRQKRRMEPPLSQRRIIKDSYKEKRAKRDDSVHFNMGFMPGNSWRCLACREGFSLDQAAKLICPKCGSADLTEHSREFVR